MTAQLFEGCPAWATPPRCQHCALKWKSGCEEPLRAEPPYRWGGAGRAGDAVNSRRGLGSGIL